MSLRSGGEGGKEEWLAMRANAGDAGTAGDAGVAPTSDRRLPTSYVELFGVPRLIAGGAVLAAGGATLADLAADLVRRYPMLAGRVLDAATGWPLDWVQLRRRRAVHA